MPSARFSTALPGSPIAAATRSCGQLRRCRSPAAARSSTWAWPARSTAASTRPATSFARSSIPPAAHRPSGRTSRSIPSRTTPWDSTSTALTSPASSSIPTTPPATPSTSPWKAWAIRSRPCACSIAPPTAARTGRPSRPICPRPPQAASSSILSMPAPSTSPPMRVSSPRARLPPARPLHPTAGRPSAQVCRRLRWWP